MGNRSLSLTPFGCEMAHQVGFSGHKRKPMIIKTQISKYKMKEYNNHYIYDVFLKFRT